MQTAATCLPQPRPEVVCVCVQAVICCLLIGYPGQKKPCHLILHGMCCTKFGISVESSRGRWGTMGGKRSTLDCQFKLNTAMYYSNKTSTNQFLNPVMRVQICLNCIFSTHFTQSTEIYF